jgi:hypothetical protein
LVDEKEMVNVNCLAFFSKDGPRRCHRSHVGLAFDLDCKSAFPHSDHLFSMCPSLLDRSPNADLLRRVLEICHCPCACSSHIQNMKDMKDLSLSNWFDRIHRCAPSGSFQENLVVGGTGK